MFLNASLVRSVLIALALVAGLIYNAGTPQGRAIYGHPLAFDFNAFYCAGRAVDAGADPYLAEPLRACEHANPAGEQYPAPVAVPAPLPGYTLALFAALGRLPFDAAAALWVAIELLALILAASALKRLTGFPLAVIGAALALSAGTLSLILGQLVPLLLASLCLCADALERGRIRTAALAATAAMVEPHIGLPACLALAIWIPGTRPILAAAGAALAGVSLLTLGLAENVEYAVRVLPAHALAEIGNEEQYALSPMLFQFGIGAGTARLLGTLSYLVSISLGIAAAKRVAGRLAAPAAIALLPPASALVGGTFLHVTQMSVAIPILLLIAARSPRSRTLAGTGVLLLAVPWGVFGQLVAMLPLVGAVVTFLAIALLGAPLRYAALGGVTAIAFVAALMNATPGSSPDPAGAALAVADGKLLAEASWAAAIDAGRHGNILVSDIAKLPTWAALGAMVVCATSLAAGERRFAGAASEGSRL